MVIKSGKDKDGWRVNKPSENIIIHDVQVNSAHGAIAIGSEMSGDIRNVYVYNINIGYVDYGIRLKSMLGRGGVVEKIWMKDFKISRAIKSAIEINLKYGTPPKDYDKKKPPIFRDITIENLICRRTKNATTLIGLQESPLENITLKNIDIKATKDIYRENIKNEKFENIQIETN